LNRLPVSRPLEQACKPSCIADDQEIVELVGRAREGDAVALRLLLGQFHDLLLSHIEQRLPDHLEKLCWGDDVLAESMASIAQGIKTFEFRGRERPKESFMAWICSIAEHRVIDLVRQERSQKRPPAQRRIDPGPAYPGGSTVDGGPIMADPSPSPSRQARMGEFQAAVNSALDRIYPGYREVVELRLTLGLSNAQIAARLGRNEAAIRKLFCRAIQQLREEIGDSSEYLSRG
jgi:RNA polymerase sigma factor (sigma-70 family)